MPTRSRSSAGGSAASSLRAPSVVFGAECREPMRRGFDTLARLLSLTLGPRGGNIVSQRVNTTGFEPLDDGATIARRFTDLPDRMENAGAMMMRHIVWHMRERFGDGSVTAAVLARGIARELHRLIAGGADPVLLQRGLEKGVAAAVAALEALSVPLTEPEHVAGVARAVIEDPRIAQLLAEMIDVLGPYGNILIQPGYGLGHDYGFREGSRFPGEYISRYLLSDKFRHIAALDEPYVVVADFHFEEPGHVLHLLDLVTQAGGDRLFIICKNMWERAIDALVAANRRGPVTAYAARIKPVEDLRRDMMRDFALLTGAAFITDVAGMGPHDLTAADLGRAERLVATEAYVSVVGGGGDAPSVEAQTGTLQSRLDLVEEREEREQLRERIGRLQGGIGELRVGAYTESERNALVERAAHAVKVVQVGLEGGVVPGGGAAYLDVIPAVEAAACGHGEEAMGMRALARALEEPARVIATNADAYGPLVVNACRERGPGYAYEVGQGCARDMVEAGIVDPTLVVKAALEQAASGAAMLISAEALVLPRTPEEVYRP